MKRDTVLRLLESARKSNSEKVKDEIIESILLEFGDNITSDNKRVLVERVYGQATDRDVLNTLKNFLEEK